MHHPVRGRVGSRFFLLLGLSVALAAIVFRVSAAPESAENQAPLDAVASDPAALGWMVGSPPPLDRILRFEDGSYFRFPGLRWSVSNFRRLMPTTSRAVRTYSSVFWP